MVETSFALRHTPFRAFLPDGDAVRILRPNRMAIS
jgi:hypothetical protein